MGFVGSTGSVGFVGSEGSTGSEGFVGSVGSTGSVGFVGSVGSTGSDGFVGSVGSTGSDGSVGSEVSTGWEGSEGSEVSPVGAEVQPSPPVPASTSDAHTDRVTLSTMESTSRIDRPYVPAFFNISTISFACRSILM